MADSSLIRVPTRNHSRAVQGSISAMWWAGVSESTAFHSLESANRYRMSGGVCGGRSVLDAGCWEHGPVRGASSRDDCGERSGPSSPSTRWDSIPRAEPPRTKRLRERVRWCLAERGSTPNQGRGSSDADETNSSARPRAGRQLRPMRWRDRRLANRRLRSSARRWFRVPRGAADQATGLLPLVDRRG